MANTEPEETPREQDVRGRIPVKAEYAAEAAAAFKASGFQPIYVENGDRAVSFWFGMDVDADACRVAMTVPLEWYAMHRPHRGET